MSSLSFSDSLKQKKNVLKKTGNKKEIITPASLGDIEGEFYSSLWSDIYQLLSILIQQLRNGVDQILDALYKQSQNMQTPGMEWSLNTFYEIRERLFPAITTRVLAVLNEGTMTPEVSKEASISEIKVNNVVNNPRNIEYLTREVGTQSTINLPIVGSVRKRLEDLWEAFVTIMTEVSTDASDIVRGLNPNFGEILDIINDVTEGRYGYSNISELKLRTKHLWGEIFPPLDVAIAEIQENRKRR